MKHATLLSACMVALTASALTANAETLSYIGANIGYTTGDRDEGNPTDQFFSFGLDALVSYEFSPGLRAAFEADYYTNSSDGDLLLGGRPAGDIGQLAAHLLYDISPVVTAGAFAAYGVAQAQEGDPNERYTYYALGLQGSLNVTDRIGAYAQLAFVDQPDETLASGGYRDGYAARIGGTYALNESTQFFADYQFGEANGYEDETEDGLFQRFALGGETSIGDTPWAINYEVALESYDALSDTNHVEVATLNIGVRYYFGGNSASDLRSAGLHSIPDIINRASLFTDALD